ncbi:hypothetical protein D6D01_03967 [Aureobasidium pullulans]|uniref:Chromo domain-containing protein n=1 Tax=Aureobasidium pullulans TaxID=5580 RepID=A0A4S9LH31_AURPU|nr:hypothetical protein D6D01_03967 [Aureobasidium pullulans]
MGKAERTLKKARLPDPEPEDESDPEPELEDGGASEDVEILEEGEFKVRNIVAEKGNKYRIDWEDAPDGTTYDKTWEPKVNVNQAAIDDWEEKKRLKEEAKKQPKRKGRVSTLGRTSTVGRASRAGRSSGAGHASEAPIQIDDDDDSEDDTPLKKKLMTASGSKPPVVLKIHRTSRPIVEVSPPVSKLPGSSKDKLGRQMSADTPAPAKRSVGRPRKSFPEAVRQGRDQDRDNEDSPEFQYGIDDEAGPSAVHQGPARPKGFQLSKPPKDDIEDGPSNEQQLGRKPRRSSSLLFVGDGESSEGEVQNVPSKQNSASPSKPLPRKSIFTMSASVDVLEVPLKIQNARKRRVIAESSDDEVQHVKEVVQHTEPSAAPKRGRGRPRKYPPPTQKDRGPKRSRGRPRKTPVAVARSPVTSAATSRNEEIGTTEIDDSDAFDPAAAQLQREVRSARKTSPRQPSSEFDEGTSEFRSSQILRGTQPEPARSAEQVTAVENVEEDSEIMVDAAAASSLSQKNSPYEPDTTSQSIFDSNDGSTGLAINSSSGVHTLLVPLARRFGADVIIPDSQSYLDASSVYISEHQVEPGPQSDVEMEDCEDESTESQIAVVMQQAIEQQTPMDEHDVPQSSIAQVRTTNAVMRTLLSNLDLVAYDAELRVVIGSANFPPQQAEGPRLPNVAAATQSEPSIETSIQHNISNKAISVAASGPIAQVSEHISTRSGSPVSVGAARSSSTSSAPPAESADKSTQSQHSHRQLGSSSQNEEFPPQPQTTSVPESYWNSDQDPESESVQVPSIASQQSHVQQAAQQVSFDHRPDQPQPVLPFLQSSVEENTPSSSSEFLTQVNNPGPQPVQQASSLDAPTFPDQIQRPGSAQSSSFFPSVPSRFPNTVGESAPSRIRSVSESGLASGTSQNSNMDTPGSSDNRKPAISDLHQRLMDMRANSKAKYEAETIRLRPERERRLAEKRAVRIALGAPAHPPGVAPAHPAVVAPAPVPALQALSPKPASAVPARLMSPAMTDRETRSPSTVPPVEIVPEEAPEDYSRSERYETLLPGEGPQINSNNSRNVFSDSAMPDVSLDDGVNNQHVVSIDFGVQQRDYYTCSFNNNKALIDEFTERVWPENSDIAGQARAYMRTLHNFVNHLDLNDPETANSPPMPPAGQVEWDVSQSSKFNFLRSLLFAAKAHNLHVALLVDPGRLAAIIQTFLQGIDTMYNVIDGQNNVVNQNSTATILLTSVDADPDVSSLELDMIVAIDGSTPSEVITRTQKMLSSTSLLPAISIVVPRSVEHAVRCIPAAMPEAERLHVLLSTATNERFHAGWASGGADTEFDRKASDIISWILNPAESDWLLYGIPELQLVEALSSQPSSEDELMVANNGPNGNRKRPLDEYELPIAKKVHVEEPLPMTINPADMHLPSGTMPISHSHVSDSVAASSHALIFQQLNTAQRQVREYEQAMERLQFNSEEQRASMVQAQLERNSALEREENLKKTNRTLQDRNIALRDEVLELKKQLESARVALAEHTVPERAELEQSLAESRAAIAEKEKQTRLAKSAEDRLEYLRDQYQTRSNDLTAMTISNAQQEKRIAELEIRASGEQAKLRTMNLDSHAKKLQDSWNKTKASLAAKEALCQTLSEENARLRDTRGRGVSTRATSIPRSRPSSPAASVRPRHPLSKGSPA